MSRSPELSMPGRGDLRQNEAPEQNSLLRRIFDRIRSALERLLSPTRPSPALSGPVLVAAMLFCQEQVKAEEPDPTNSETPDDPIQIAYSGGDITLPFTQSEAIEPPPPTPEVQLPETLDLPLEPPDAPEIPAALEITPLPDPPEEPALEIQKTTEGIELHLTYSNEYFTEDLAENSEDPEALYRVFQEHTDLTAQLRPVEAAIKLSARILSDVEEMFNVNNHSSGGELSEKSEKERGAGFLEDAFGQLTGNARIALQFKSLQEAMVKARLRPVKWETDGGKGNVELEWEVDSSTRDQFEELRATVRINQALSPINGFLSADFQTNWNDEGGFAGWELSGSFGYAGENCTINFNCLYRPTSENNPSESGFAVLVTIPWGNESRNGHSRRPGRTLLERWRGVAAGKRNPNQSREEELTEKIGGNIERGINRGMLALAQAAEAERDAQ